MLKYKLKKFNRRKTIIWSTIILLFIISGVSLINFYAASLEGEGTASGISGTVVTVNDLTNDYNYYTSLNFTEITNKNTLPSGTNSNRYNDNNLLKVKVIYDGHDINDNSLVGTVSNASGENQNQYVYYKYYVVKNNKIDIELIDNPFSHRPNNNRMFEGWACNSSGSDSGVCANTTLSYDDTYYLRHATVDVTGKSTLTIKFNAVWGTGVYSNANEFDDYTFSDKTMQKVEVQINPVYQSRTVFLYWNFSNDRTYYERRTISNNQYYPSGAILSNGTTVRFERTNRCTSGSCYYYVETDDDYYHSDKTYYMYTYNFVAVTESTTYLTRVNGNNGNNVNVREVVGYRSSMFDNNDSTSGYYYYVGNSYNASSGLYYDYKGINCSESGNDCNSGAYKLIQASETLTDGSATINMWKTENYTYDNGTPDDTSDDITSEIDVNDISKYYYLVTRDTNILNVNANMNLTTANNLEKPLTITGTGGTLTISRNAMAVKNDMVIENVRTNGTTYSDRTLDGGAPRGAGYTIVANGYNLKLGRNISTNSTYAFVGITGNNTDTAYKNKVMVESGNYVFARTSTSSVSNEHIIMQYGSDYDRVSNNGNGNNSKLQFYFQVIGSDSGNHNSNTITPVSEMIIKSGSYGTRVLNSTNQASINSYYIYGVYVGALASGDSTGLRTLKLEGGRIFEINGGPCISSGSENSNVIATYMTGGTVDVIIGGAGTSTTYGNRIVSVTGGKVNIGVAGGSNSYGGRANDGTSGPCLANTLVYIGGNATIGDGAAKTLFDVDHGSVFGAGLGNNSGNGTNNFGHVKNSHVVINGGNMVNVYGGGNYGTVGSGTGYGSQNMGVANTTVDILNGNVTSAVYGGANQNGFSKYNHADQSTLTINMNGGTVGYIYGGSNTKGNVYGTVTVNLNKGTVVNDVFGGGYGTNTNTYNNIRVNTNVTNNDDFTAKNIYGGSAQGKTNTQYNATGYTTRVNINGGKITEAVYGGGKGVTGNAGAVYTYGNTTVTVDKGIINEVFGGHNVNGAMGSNNVTSQVVINGGTINNVYGGSNGSAASATTTNVTVNGANIMEGVYGGGKQATSTTTNVTVKGGTFVRYDGDGNIDGTPASVYGGGFQAGVTSSTNGTNVNILAGAHVYDVFGGSNEQGTVVKSVVNLTDGEVLCNAYGGGNIAPTTTTNLNINGSIFTHTIPQDQTSEETIFTNTCGSAFGGGKSANVTTSNITLEGTSRLISMYGGSNMAGTVMTSNVNVRSGDVEVVFGGNNQGGVTNVTNVNFDKTGSAVQYVFGGSNGSGAGIGTNNQAATNTNINRGVITYDVFGGGNEAGANGNIIVNIRGGEVRSVYGGGNKAFIGTATTTSDGLYVSCQSSKTTKVNVVNGTIHKNVYGSGNASFVCGDTNINIGNYALTDLGINYNNYNITIEGSVFGGSETNAKETETLDFSNIGVDGDTHVNISGNSYYPNNSQKLSIGVSVLGSGNNSIQTGNAYIDFNNVGLDNSPLVLASIQRATRVRITDSIIELNGARDRASTAIYYYGLIRIGNLYLLGSPGSGNNLHGSTLYMKTGASFLAAYYSGVMNGNTFTPQEAQKTATGMTDKVSKNKLYMYANKILSVSDSAVPSYESGMTNAGYVKGMTFLGMYVRSGNNSITKGQYDPSYSINGATYTSTQASQDLDEAYTYVYGKHELDPEEQIEKHGFYTNYVEDGVINVDYVGVTPDNADYYKWTIGVAPAKIVVDLQATKYSVEGAANATIDLAELKEKLQDGTPSNIEWHDATMKINKINTNQFGAKGSDVTRNWDTYLVDRTQISPVNNNDNNGDGVIDANNYFALSMGTTTNGWLDNYKTNFFSDTNGIESFCDVSSSGGCTGSEKYWYDSTTIQRSLTFWLYYSKNLDFSYSVEEERAEKIISLGTITVETDFHNPHGDPSDPDQRVTIEINVTMNDGDKDGYGKAISPGKKYEVFQSKATSIVANGTFSIYQSLSLDLTQPMASNPRETWSVDKIYGAADPSHNLSETYRYLVSDYHLPVGATITMLDLKNGEQYYYKVTNSNYNGLPTNNNGDYVYKLEDFIRMGSTTTTNNFDDDMLGEDSLKYYSYTVNDETGKKDKEFAVEEFIFTVDLSGVAESQQVTTTQTHYLYMEINRDENNVMLPAAIIGPVGDPTNEMKYSLVPNIDTTIDTTGGFVQADGTVGDSTTIYVGEQTELELDTTLKHENSSHQVVTNVDDTTFDDYKLGAKITIWQAKKNGEGEYIYDGSGQLVYEQLTTDLFGTVLSVNGVDYFPQTDGSTRLKLAGRITDVVSSINIDFENSSLEYGDYKLVVETFASYDGLYYGDFGTTVNSYLFTLLNNEYGIDVTIPPVQVTRDVNTGKDKNGDQTAQFTVKTKNGLANPNIKVTLQRRVYNNETGYYGRSYVDVPLSNIASEMHFDGGTANVLESCFGYTDGQCTVYNLGAITNSLEPVERTATLTFKDKNAIRAEVSNPATSGWKSGTYRLQFIMYDGNTEVGRVYEYIIIRSLDVDENIEGS